MSRARKGRPPAAPMPLLPVVRIGQAAVGDRTYPAVTLDGSALKGAIEPHRLVRRLSQGFRATVTSERRAGGVRLRVAIEAPLQAQFCFEVRSADLFSEAFLGGVMLTGHLVVNFSALPATLGRTGEGATFIETEGLVLSVPPGALAPGRL